MSDNTKTYNICVASSNTIKLSAVYQAFNIFMSTISNEVFVINIHGINIESGIKNQPLGIETTVGCINRMNKLIEHATSNSNIIYDILVSIENGIEYTDSDLYVEDFCCIEILYETKRFLYKSGYKTRVDKIYLDKSIETERNLTAGHFIKEINGKKIDPQDFHIHMDTYETVGEVVTKHNLSRKDIIKFTILNSLKENLKIF